MSNVGEVIFDRSSDNHEEIWDDTELIRAYDRAKREIENRLKNNSKTKKDTSSNRQKRKNEHVKQAATTVCPTPIPIDMLTPPKDEQDALQSMLMSWYMAGYHAGQLAAKKQKKNA